MLATYYVVSGYDAGGRCPRVDESKSGMASIAVRRLDDFHNGFLIADTEMPE